MSLLKYGVRETPETCKSSDILSGLLKKVECSAMKRGLFHRGSSLLLAVSGGADSVSMLHLFVALKERMQLDLCVAHYDHCLRGSESRRDAEFVRELAGAAGLTFILGSGNVRDLVREKKISVQEAARMLRYGFLENVRVQQGADVIATAHTADDQAEEVLARLIRGSGLQGLAGIPWKSENRVVRPLLGMYSREIRSFLQCYSLPHVEDSSNRKRKYLRNRIRLDLIPFMQDRFNPAIIKGLNRTAGLLADDREVLDGIASDAFRECACRPQGDEERGGMVFSRQALLRIHAAIRRRVYRMALKKLGGIDGAVTAAHLIGIDRLVQGNNPSGVIGLPHGFSAARTYNRLVISAHDRMHENHLPAACEKFDILLEGPGVFGLPGRCGELTLKEASLHKNRLANREDFPKDLFLDIKKVHFPLYARSREPGDRFCPFGRLHERRLKKFLINRKIPRYLRDCIPLLVMDHTIIAVGGVEVAESVAVSPGSDRGLVFKWSGPAVK